MVPPVISVANGSKNNWKTSIIAGLNIARATFGLPFFVIKKEKYSNGIGILFIFAKILNNIFM